MHALSLLHTKDFFIKRQQGPRGGKGKEEKKQGGKGKEREREEGRKRAKQKEGREGIGSGSERKVKEG